MFRNVLLRSARAVPRMTVPLYRPTPAFSNSLRAYSASALSSEDITLRILDVLKSFEKVNPDKVSSLYSTLEERRLRRGNRLRLILVLPPILDSIHSIRSRLSWQYVHSISPTLSRSNQLIPSQIEEGNKFITIFPNHHFKLTYDF